MTKDMRLPLVVETTPGTTHRHIVDANGQAICQTYPNADGRYDKRRTDHIVLAVNCHDDLLAACKELLLLVDDFMPNIGKCALQNYERMNEAPIAARVAITKATS